MTDEVDAQARELSELAREIRERILRASVKSGESTHLGGSLSLVEVLAVLYGSILNVDPRNPTTPDRDRLILSKGHGVLALYAVLLLRGYFDEAKFLTFMQDESDLVGHPVMKPELGIESSNGSLGHGLSLAAGMAWASARRSSKARFFVILGDGECNEGSVWEAAAHAAQAGLRNLVAIVDWNGFQSDDSTEQIISSTQLPEKWKAFGWHVKVVEGHNVATLRDALSGTFSAPTVILARTTKGAGVPSMEDDNRWHHRRLTAVQLAEMGVINEA